MVKKLTKITVEEFLHFGCDHINVAMFLFRNPTLNTGNNTVCITLDSAAYLYNIGIEQLLKAFYLWEKGFYEEEHGIYKIAKKIDFLSSELSDESWKLLKSADFLGLTRYPRQNKGHGVNIDQNHYSDAQKLIESLLHAMPDELFHVYEKIGAFEGYVSKGGRILMRKKEKK